MKFLMRLMIHLIAVPAAFVLTLLCACSTISSRQTLSYPFPPAKAADVAGRSPIAVDAALEKQHLADAGNEPLRLLVRFQQAKLWAATDAAKSCALWNEILQEKRFPLWTVAQLRALEVCTTTDAGDAESTPLEPWLTEDFVKSNLKRAQKMGDQENEMKLSVRAAAFEKLQTDKISLLQRALALAKEQKNETAKREIQEKLERVAPRFIENPKAEQYQAVALDFRQVRNFETARSWFKKIVTSSEFSNDEKLSALDGIRMSYKLEKKTDLYISETKNFSDFAEENFLKPGVQLAKANKKSPEAAARISRYLNTRMTLARAVWTEGAPAEALKILLRAEKETKRFVPVDESVLIRARIEEEAGRFANAVKIFKSIKLTNQNRDFRSKVLWFRAWNERKIGRLKEAADGLRELIPQEDSPTQVSRDTFWLGKILKELGQEEESKAQFEKLITDDSLGWYGLLAYRELGTPLPPLERSADVRSPASLFRSEKKPESALMPEEKLTFEWLIAGGESDLARKFLDFTTADRRSAYSDAQSLDLLQMYASAGQYLSLFSRLYELPSAQRKRLLETNPELLFPQPWPTLVKTASARFDVQSELIYSIMRQESSFNPTARSPADAFGLMQLIPEMAKRAGTTAGIKIESHEDLYEPEINIPLGAAFVRDLQNYWSSGFIPTVASYNASEKAISGWIRSRYKGDTLAFIEDVPYEETRNYIKLVMRNFIFYKRLNSGGAPVPFPEWCLANLHDANP